MNNAVKLDFANKTAQIICADTETGTFTPVLIDLDAIRIVDAATDSAWFVCRTSESNPTKYVMTKCKRTKKTLYLHRLLCPGTARGLEVAHLNHDGQDNRKDNLKAVDVRTHRLLDGVAHNRPHKRNKLGVRGVRELKNGLFEAYYNDEKLGRYGTVQAAAAVSKAHRDAIYAMRSQQLTIPAPTSIPMAA